MLPGRLERLSADVADAYRKFSFSEIVISKRCSYDLVHDRIRLNFTSLTSNLKRLKLCHELAHRVQRNRGLIYDRKLAEIELEAIYSSLICFLDMGYELDEECLNYLNYNMRLYSYCKSYCKLILKWILKRHTSQKKEVQSMLKAD